MIMKKGCKRRSYIYIYIVISILAIGGFVLYKNKNTIYINSVLTQKSYRYLPNEAKEYIKDIYNKTGEVILTEKNKKANKLYLNPVYVSYLTYSQDEKDKLGEIPVPMVIDYSIRNVSNDINVPSSYDLRNVDSNNYVTPIRNQGNLGLCWTFATAGAAESRLLKLNNASYDSSSKLISERQIDYATSRNGIKNYKSEYVSFINRSLGDGGNFYISTILLANGISYIDYNNFKEYNDSDLQKMELSDVLSYDKSLYEVNSTINVPRLNLRESTSILTEEEIETRDSYLKEVKQNIMEKGAAYVSTLMHSSCRYTDSNLNNTVIDVYHCSSISGHAMQIIGWDDDIEYSYCADDRVHKSNISGCNNIVSGKGVWILKNSWGDSIQNPYLTYDSLYTGISFIDEISSSENKNWDNNYVLGDGLENIKSKIYTLNDTKIKNDEKIKKVKFITENPETEYNVKIKKKNGSYRTFSKTSDLPGLMTIDITEDILVNKDTEITIYSDNGFIDRVSVFTENVDTEPTIDLSKYDSEVLTNNVFRLYSDTKNIPSGATIIYKLYNSNNQDITDYMTITNNIVAENNINTLVDISNNLGAGEYHIDAIYNSNVIGTMNFNIVVQEGSGTKNDPYIITNSTQLYNIRNDLDAYYELGNDIDLTVDTHEGGIYSYPAVRCPQGHGWEAINGFSGSLDGKGHTIKGLYQNNYISCNDMGSVYSNWNDNGNGLFATMKGNATVKNLILEDFDITCQGGYCGLLVSKYISNMNDLGYFDTSDQTEYTATFENIAIKNSKMKGVHNSSNADNSLINSYGGGLFGYFESYYGNINISNIYLDIDLTFEDNKYASKTGFLLSALGSGKQINISNIRLQGNFVGRTTSGNDNAILVYQVFSNANFKNIISTMNATNVSGSLFKETSSSMSIANANILDIGKPLWESGSSQNEANINLYNKDTQIVEFTKEQNYNSWDNFNDNWVIETIDGITRIPVLKFMNFDYTSISDIILNQVLNEKVTIYDYITPRIDAARNIIFRSNNENIVTLLDDGTIVPKATGNTTIHVESLYDGYIKDVPISVTYVPHYTINFDANGGTGTMDSIEVEVGESFKLPENEFVRENYELKEWNTEADGTGTAYDDLEEISTLNDKESITLYAIWRGEERVVTFNPNGGTVSPERKVVRYSEEYGELPIPTKAGCGFLGWNPVGKSSTYINFNNKLYIYNSLIANWRENAYTLIYDANGGKINEYYDGPLSLVSDSLAVTYGNNNAIKYLYYDFYNRDGYTFTGWNTKADGSGDSYVNGQSIEVTTVPDSTLRLYAMWEKNGVTITFNSNYGTIETRVQNVSLNESVKLDKNTFTRDDYVFKNWNTKADGSGISYSDEQVVSLNKDITLYAIWEEIVPYTINNLDVDEDNRYIKGININTEVNNYTPNFTLGYGYGIDVDTKTINNKQVLYTGGKTRITKGLTNYRTYTNVVSGDTNGDGKINYLDYVNVYNHIQKVKHPELNKTLLVNEYLLAGDMTNDNKINYLDYVRIYNKIKELKGGSN